MRNPAEPIPTIEPLVEIGVLTSIFGVSRGTIRRWVEGGVFPQPLRVNRRLIRWKLSEVQAFIESKGNQDAKHRIATG